MSYLVEHTQAQSAQATRPATHSAGERLEILQQPILSHITKFRLKTNLYNAATTRGLWFHDLNQIQQISKALKNCATLLYLETRRPEVASGPDHNVGGAATWP